MAARSKAQDVDVDAFIKKIEALTPKPGEKPKPFIGSSPETKEMLLLFEAAFARKRATILWGPPGIGKSSVIQAFALNKGVILKTLIGSSMPPDSVEGLPVIAHDEKGRPYTANTLVDWAKEIIDAGGGILFLDEWSNCPPAVQAIFLNIITTLQIGQYKLPANTWIIAAANDVADAADGFTLAPPMANRLMHINYQPVFKDWVEGMRVNFNKPQTANEQELRLLFTLFLEQNKDLYWNVRPKSDEAAGKAWPSPRTWDAAADVCSLLMDHELVFKTALEGNVGETAGQAFLKWRRNLQLPTLETLLSNPRSINWAALQPSVVYVLLQMAVAHLDEHNVDACVEVIRSVVDAKALDIVAGIAQELALKANRLAKEGKLERPRLMKTMLLLAPLNQEAGLSDEDEPDEV